MRELFFLYQGFSSTNSVLKMIGLIILCALIIAASYFVTRFVGKKQMGKMNGGNFKVIETFRLTNNKYLQLIKIGVRYFVIGISKDEISLITELKEDELAVVGNTAGEPASFKDILSGIAKRNKTKDNPKDSGFDQIKEYEKNRIEKVDTHEEDCQ